MRFLLKFRLSAAIFFMAIVTLVSASLSLSAQAETNVTIIEMTQTPCQILQAENDKDHGYKSTRKSDCDEINAKTAHKRLQAAKVLNLKPGKYIFRVTNKNVPYTLGFWLRHHDYNWTNPLHKLTKTSVSGGGLETGKTQDYTVELSAGEYLYSCPLNTTPDYKLIVTN